MAALAEPRAWRSVVMGRRGAVASNHPLATGAGLDVLKAGGNAFDAAVAVASTIAVVEPSSNGVGGDGFFLLYDGVRAHATVVHAAAPSAAAATREQFADGIPYHGVRAAMPPGAAAGWLHIAEHYATRPAEDLFRAAVHYARDGFPASRALCHEIESNEAQLVRDRGCAEVFLREGRPPRFGATLRNPALARTLEALAVGGSEVLFGGELGDALCGFVREAGGLIAPEDLAAHRASEHPPLSTTYRGLTVLNADRPSMGFALLLELAIADRFDLAAMGHLSADALHVAVEAKKLSFTEREELAGDPAQLDSTLDLLLERSTAREIAQSIDMKRAKPAPGSGNVAGDTTYFCVVDGFGNAVSGIQSIAGPFGACALDPTTGILLNNRMVWFHLEPDHPNVLAPRKHVRNTINPPMALEDGVVRCVWGTPGGDAQVQTSLQTLTAVFDHGLDPQQAQEMPRWTHFQPGTGSYYPHIDTDLLVMESRFPPEAVDELRRRGHNVSLVGPLEAGCASSMILRDRSGLLVCGSDPRKDCWAGAF